MSYIAGNAQVTRFRLNNLVIGSVGAAGSLNVDATITALPANMVGSIGFALPVDADLTAALPPPSVRLTAVTTLRLRFANPSAGAIDPVDTFDWDVYLFTPSGNVQQTI